MKPLHLMFWFIALATPWATLHADPWGRLFTTPVQRAQLDSGQTAPAKTDDSTSDTPQPGVTERIRLTGTLTSSRGTRTAWLNGKPVTQGVRVLGPGRVQLSAPAADKRRLLKSGQLLYPQTGEIVEGYAAPQVAPGDAGVQTETESAQAPM